MYSVSETASKASAEDGGDVVMVDRDSCPRGLPVRILVYGHCDEDMEPRLVWSADGLACEMQLAPVSMMPPTDSSENEALSISPRGIDRKGDIKEHKSISKEEEDISGDWQELVEVSEAGWWQRCVSPGEEYLLFWEEEVLRAPIMQAVLSQKIHDKLR